MDNNDIYKSWRDKLLLEINKRICTPCTDERKKQYNLDFENPLQCGCRCERVNGLLENIKNINDDVEN